MRREMTDTVGRTLGTMGLEHLVAYLDAETEQERTAAGLVVSFGLTNHGADALPLLNPFALVQFQVRTNGQAVDPSSLNTRIVTIGAGAACRVTYEIARLLEATTSGEPAGGSADMQDGAITDGMYRVRCIVTLIHAEQTQASRIVQPEEIAIRFARRS